LDTGSLPLSKYFTMTSARSLWAAVKSLKALTILLFGKLLQQRVLTLVYKKRPE
jgi:hypothetical protein